MEKLARPMSALSLMPTAVMAWMCVAAATVRVCVLMLALAMPLSRLVMAAVVRLPSYQLLASQPVHKQMARKKAKT